MILDDLQEIIDNAKCPETFPEDLNIGACNFIDDDSQNYLIGHPKVTAMHLCISRNTKTMLAFTSTLTELVCRLMTLR